MNAREITCRQCGKKTVYSPENPFRPFCSERCKTIDLGDWASESYRIASQSGSVQELAEELEDEESRRESEQES